MANIVRTATTLWRGGLRDGSGVCSTGTGVLSETPVSWAARTEEPAATSPEELIAAAHASCYAMALSNVLAEAGHAPERLDVACEVTATLDAGGLKVTRSALNVRGQVQGVDQQEFARLAAEGERACPVSNALRGAVEITVEASLVS